MLGRWWISFWGRLFSGVISLLVSGCNLMSTKNPHHFSQQPVLNQQVHQFYQENPQKHRSIPEKKKSFTITKLTYFRTMGTVFLIQKSCRISYYAKKEHSEKWGFPPPPTNSTCHQIMATPSKRLCSEKFYMNVSGDILSWNPKQQFKMDVLWNNHFLCKGLESSNWNHHDKMILYVFRVPGLYNHVRHSTFASSVCFRSPRISSQTSSTTRSNSHRVLRP